jgi:hypothetical protein
MNFTSHRNRKLLKVILYINIDVITGRLAKIVEMLSKRETVEIVGKKGFRNDLSEAQQKRKEKKSFLTTDIVRKKFLCINGFIEISEEDPFSGTSDSILNEILSNSFDHYFASKISFFVLLFFIFLTLFSNFFLLLYLILNYLFSYENYDNYYYRVWKFYNPLIIDGFTISTLILILYKFIHVSIFHYYPTFLFNILFLLGFTFVSFYFSFMIKVKTFIVHHIYSLLNLRCITDDHTIEYIMRETDYGENPTYPFEDDKIYRKTFLNLFVEYFFSFLILIRLFLFSEPWLFLSLRYLFLYLLLFNKFYFLTSIIGIIGILSKISFHICRWKSSEIRDFLQCLPSSGLAMEEEMGYKNYSFIKNIEILQSSDGIIIKPTWENSRIMFYLLNDPIFLIEEYFSDFDNEPTTRFQVKENLIKNWGKRITRPRQLRFLKGKEILKKDWKILSEDEKDSFIWYTIYSPGGHSPRQLLSNNLKESFMRQSLYDHELNSLTLIENRNTIFTYVIITIIGLYLQYRLVLSDVGVDILFPNTTIIKPFKNIIVKGLSKDGHYLSKARPQLENKNIKREKINYKEEYQKKMEGKVKVPSEVAVNNKHTLNTHYNVVLHNTESGDIIKTSVSTVKSNNSSIILHKDPVEVRNISDAEDILNGIVCTGTIISKNSPSHEKELKFFQNSQADAPNQELAERMLKNEINPRILIDKEIIEELRRDNSFNDFYAGCSVNFEVEIPDQIRTNVLILIDRHTTIGEKRIAKEELNINLQKFLNGPLSAGMKIKIKDILETSKFISEEHLKFQEDERLKLQDNNDLLLLSFYRNIIPLPNKKFTYFDSTFYTPNNHGVIITPTISEGIYVGKYRNHQQDQAIELGKPMKFPVLGNYKNNKEIATLEKRENITYIEVKEIPTKSKTVEETE